MLGDGKEADHGRAPVVDFGVRGGGGGAVVSPCRAPSWWWRSPWSSASWSPSTGTSRPAVADRIGRDVDHGDDRPIRPAPAAAGVTAHSIRVVFPVSNLTSLSCEPRIRG